MAATLLPDPTTSPEKPTAARMSSEDDWAATWEGNITLGLPSDETPGIKVRRAHLQGALNVRQARFQALALLKDLTRQMEPNKTVAGRFVSSMGPGKSCFIMLLRHNLCAADIQRATVPAAILAP